MKYINFIRAPSLKQHNNFWLWCLITSLVWATMLFLIVSCFITYHRKTYDLNRGFQKPKQLLLASDEVFQQKKNLKDQEKKLRTHASYYGKNNAKKADALSDIFKQITKQTGSAVDIESILLDKTTFQLVVTASKVDKVMPFFTKVKEIKDIKEAHVTLLRPQGNKIDVTIKGTLLSHK